MPLIMKTASTTILYVQPDRKFRSPPGHFHHEPPHYLPRARQWLW